MTYGELQHNLIRKVLVYLNVTYGGTTETVQVIHADGYALGADNISRVTVIWTHPEFDNNQIDTVELDRLYTEEVPQA